MFISPKLKQKLSTQEISNFSKKSYFLIKMNKLAHSLAIQALKSEISQKEVALQIKDLLIPDEDQ